MLLSSVKDFKIELEDLIRETTKLNILVEKKLKVKSDGEQEGLSKA